MHFLIQSTAAAVIRRINFPKRLTGRMTREQSQRASLRPLLSEHDEQDARQTVALVLCQLGISDETQAALQRAQKIAALCPLFARSRCERASYTAAARTLGLDRWKACFRAVRGALRIDRRVREDATDFSLIDPIASNPYVRTPEISVRIEHASEADHRRSRLARGVRYAHNLLLAAFSADVSRKRKSTFQAHLATLRTLAALWGGRLASRPLYNGKSDDAVSVMSHRFRAYLNKGEIALTAATMEGIPTHRATATRNEIGELKTFAAI